MENASNWRFATASMGMNLRVLEPDSVAVFFCRIEGKPLKIIILDAASGFPIGVTRTNGTGGGYQQRRPI